MSYCKYNKYYINMDTPPIQISHKRVNLNLNKKLTIIFRDWNISVRHIPREANGVLHNLAIL